MAIDSNTAAQLVIKGYSEFSSGVAAAAARPEAAAAAAPDFCALWPKAKPILQVLVGIIAILPIPGGGAIGGGILNGLITLGDQIFKDKCGG
ncbi:MAG: hypothetical protein ACOY5F_03585 [Pseudomonadota bacterium]|jgi:hypothetical protein